MRISARCDYACKALLELSLHWPNKEPMQIGDIARKQKIPQRYLTQILIQLKRLGFVKSLQGKEGGYNLDRPPESITLGEVMRAIGGPLVPLASSVKQEKSLFFDIWKEAEQAIARVMDKVTFREICEKYYNKGKAILYQI